MTQPHESLIARFGPPDDISLAAVEDEGFKTNTERSAWALDAVMAHSLHANHGQYTREQYRIPDVLKECGGDLICDLLHLATLHGLDAEDLLETGWRRFIAEAGLGYPAIA